MMIARVNVSNRFLVPAYLGGPGRAEICCSQHVWCHLVHDIAKNITLHILNHLDSCVYRYR